MIANLIKRAAPFLSKYIPFGIASQGLKKLDPRFGSFIQSSIASGFTANEIMDYMRDKISGPEKQSLESRESRLRPDEAASLAQHRNNEMPLKVAQGALALGAGALGGGLGAAAAGADMLANEAQGQQQQQAAQKQQDSPTAILSKFSPKLAALIEQAFEAGHTPEEIEGIARSPAHGFKTTIDNMEQVLGMSFADLIRHIFGGGPKQKPPQQQQAQAQASPQPQAPQPQQGGQSPGMARVKGLLDLYNQRNKTP